MEKVAILNDIHGNLYLLNKALEYLKDKKTSWYNMPDNVVGVVVNPIDGKLAKENTQKKKILYYIKGTEPTE